MRRSWLSLFGFRWVFILLAMAERDGENLQGKSFETKTGDIKARYVTVLCIHIDDNQMTFVGYIVYLCPP